MSIKKYILERFSGRFSPYSLNDPILSTFDFSTNSAPLNFIFEKVGRPPMFPKIKNYYEMTYERYIKKGEMGSKISPGPELTNEDTEVARQLVKKYIIDGGYSVSSSFDKAIYMFFTDFYKGNLKLDATWNDLLAKL